jgi:hypothetical protein
MFVAGRHLQRAGGEAAVDHGHVGAMAVQVITGRDLPGEFDAIVAHGRGAELVGLVDRQQVGFGQGRVRRGRRQAGQGKQQGDRGRTERHGQLSEARWLGRTRNSGRPALSG